MNNNFTFYSYVNVKYEQYSLFIFSKEYAYIRRNRKQNFNHKHKQIKKKKRVTILFYNILNIFL